MRPHLLAGRPPPLTAPPPPVALRLRVRPVARAGSRSSRSASASPRLRRSRRCARPTPPTVAVVGRRAGDPRRDHADRADVRVARFPVRDRAGRCADRGGVGVGSSTAVPLAAGGPLVPGVLADDEVRGPPGTVVATVRFADPAVAGLLSPGMHVDVLAATAEGGPGGVVARRALVLPVARQPRATGGAAGLGGSGDDVGPRCCSPSLPTRRPPSRAPPPPPCCPRSSCHDRADPERTLRRRRTHAHPEEHR